MGSVYDYTTRVGLGTAGAGLKFVFTPYTTVVLPFGLLLPTLIQNKGWMYGDFTVPVAKKLWFLDGRIVASVMLRNPTTVAHSGNLYARLWIASQSDLSDATALTAWTSTLVTFDGTLNQIVIATINLDVAAPVGNAFILEGKYLYVEFLWDVVTNPGNGIVQMEATYYSKISPPGQILYFPNIAVDSAGYPWIGFMRYNGIGYYPYIAKGNANNGTWTFRLGSYRKLSTTTGLLAWRVTPIPLTVGKLRVMYHRTAEVLSDLWDGSSWTTQNPPAITLATADGLSGINEGDNTLIGVLEATTFNIKVIKHTYGVGWDAAYTTLQSSTTSTSTPILSWEATGIFKVFWAGSPTAEHIYYKTVINMVPSTDPADWIDESPPIGQDLTGNDRITGFYKAYGNCIGLLYMTKTASPYNIRYKFIPLGVRMVGNGLTWAVS